MTTGTSLMHKFIYYLNKSTCFGHLYAHLQEYISCVLLHMVFSAVKENFALVGGFIFAVSRVVHGHKYIKFACTK
jgi:hypothetical protein